MSTHFVQPPRPPPPPPLLLLLLLLCRISHVAMPLQVRHPRHARRSDERNQRPAARHRRCHPRAGAHEHARAWASRFP